MVRSFWIAGLALALAGCATMAPPPASTITHVFSRNYEPGVPKTTNVGEAMVQVEDYYARTMGYGGWVATNGFSASNGLSSYSIQPGVF